jgi:hypothetical protein
MVFIALVITVCGLAKAQIALALCGGIWAFAYMLLCVCNFFNNFLSDGRKKV